jgi:hypothetical protein
MSNEDEVYPVAYIYQLWSPFSPSVYIGSTAKSPERRLWEHLDRFDRGRNSTSARHLISEVGPSCVLVEMLEALTNISKSALHVKEQWWIDATPNTLNKARAFQKARFNVNRKDPIRYVKHLFSMYGDDTPQYAPSGSKEYMAVWYQKKKAEINAKQKARREASRVTCDVCKKTILKVSAAYHFASSKHKLNEGKSLPRTGLITPLVQRELDKYVPLAVM